MTSNAVDAAPDGDAGAPGTPDGDAGAPGTPDGDAGAPGGAGAEPVEAVPEARAVAADTRERRRH